MNEPSSSSSSSSPRNGRPRGGSGGGGRRRRPGGGGGPGGQNRSPGQGGGASSAGSYGGPAVQSDKPGLLQRVLSIFKGIVKPAAAPSRSSSSAGAGAAPNANRTGYGRVPSHDGGSDRPAPTARDRERPRDRDRERETSNGDGDASSGRGERVSRRPESVEVTTPRLYVGNLSFDTTEGDLTELFNGVGKVVSAEIVTHRQTERSKGFAFVQMTGVDEAKRAVEQLHDKEFMGRKLFLSGAKSSEPHDGRSEPRFAT